MTRDGWLEEGDVVNTGDYVVMSTGELMRIPLGGYVHRPKHNPKWRQPAPPSRATCKAVLVRWLTDREREDTR